MRSTCCRSDGIATQRASRAGPSFHDPRNVAQRRVGGAGRAAWPMVSCIRAHRRVGVERVPRSVRGRWFRPSPGHSDVSGHGRPDHRAARSAHFRHGGHVGRVARRGGSALRRNDGGPSFRVCGSTRRHPSHGRPHGPRTRADPALVCVERRGSLRGLRTVGAASRRGDRVCGAVARTARLRRRKYSLGRGRREAHDRLRRWTHLAAHVPPTAPAAVLHSRSVLPVAFVRHGLCATRTAVSSVPCHASSLDRQVHVVPPRRPGIGWTPQAPASEGGAGSCRCREVERWPGSCRSRRARTSRCGTPCGASCR